MEGVHPNYVPNTARYEGEILVQLNKVYVVQYLDPKLVVGYCGWWLAGLELRGVLRQVS